MNTKMAVCNSSGEDRGSGKGILSLTSDGVWRPQRPPFLRIHKPLHPAEERAT